MTIMRRKKRGGEKEEASEGGEKRAAFCGDMWKLLLRCAQLTRGDSRDVFMCASQYMRCFNPSFFSAAYKLVFSFKFYMKSNKPSKRFIMNLYAAAAAS